MRTRFGLIVLLVFSILAIGRPVTATTALQPIDCTVQTPAGELLLRPVNSIGARLRGLMVVEPATGETIGRIDVPLVDAAFPTALAGRAIAISGSELYLIDTRNLSATLMSLDGDSAKDLSPNPIQFRGTAGTRYMLLGSPSFDQVYLIDIEGAIATNLSTLIPVPSPDTPVFLSFAAVTPDDAHVLAWDGRHVYVYETDNPTVARQVDTGAFAFAPDFSPDGSELIFSTSDGPGSGSTLVLESIDGSRSDIIRESEHAQVTLWIPNSRSVFVDERTEDGAAAGDAFVLNLDTGEELPLLSYSGSLTSVQLSDDGRHALLGVEMMGAGDWSIANLQTGEVTSLPQLAGGRALPGLYADSPWSLVVPLGEDKDPLSGPSYRGINLETGEVARLLEQSPDFTFNQQPVLSPDGRYSLVIGSAESRQTIWLLDAAELRVEELGEGATIGARFSPDGCHIALTTESLIDGLSSFSVSVRSVVESPEDVAFKPIPGSDFAAWVR